MTQALGLHFPHQRPYEDQREDWHGDEHTACAREVESIEACGETEQVEPPPLPMQREDTGKSHEAEWDHRSRHEVASRHPADGPFLVLDEDIVAASKRPD